MAADFFGVDRVVATDAGFCTDRVVAADVDFRVVDRDDLESAVSSLMSFLTNSAFFRSAVPFTPRPCSLRRSSPTFIAAIALSRTSGVFGGVIAAGRVGDGSPVPATMAMLPDRMRRSRAWCSSALTLHPVV
jgi:hypothetical protein